MGDVVQTEKYCQQNRGKRARKTEQATWNILRWSKKNKNGDDYEPDSLRVMIAALDRHLNEKGYKFSIIRDREFHSSKQVLEGKARQLRQAGMGKRPNKARSLTEEEEEVLWEAEIFGSKTPEALISSMW